ncbi:MAG: hypothetical protein ACOY40_03770 [Bacillota bacterium]
MLSGSWRRSVRNAGPAAGRGREPEPRQDAELRAVGMTVSDEHRAGSTAGVGARLETAPPATYFHFLVVPHCGMEV